MSKLKKISIGLAIVLMGAIGLLIVQIVLISVPTHGRKIASYENPRKALLVIDIQEDFTGSTAKPPFPYKDSAQLIAAVNTLTEAATGKDMLVIYIRQELDGWMGRTLSHLFAGGTAISGNPGTGIDKRITILSGHVFPKPKSDAFSNPRLGEFLVENRVTDLFLVGLDAAGCVHNTARGALNRGYAVHIITDAIALREMEKWDGLLQEFKEEGIVLMTSPAFMNTMP